MKHFPIGYRIALLMLALSFSSCELLEKLLNGENDSDDPRICTEEFRTVGLEIIGGELDDFFTIRQSTMDTIQVDFPVLDSFYPVLDDSFQEELEGQVDEFEFVGFQEGEEVVREVFTIKADECHIEKVSGADSVTL